MNYSVVLTDKPKEKENTVQIRWRVFEVRLGQYKAIGENHRMIWIGPAHCLACAKMKLISRSPSARVDLRGHNKNRCGEILRNLQDIATETLEVK